jgi:hypothetical protein
MALEIVAQRTGEPRPRPRERVERAVRQWVLEESGKRGQGIGEARPRSGPIGRKLRLRASGGR